MTKTLLLFFTFICYSSIKNMKTFFLFLIIPLYTLPLFANCYSESGFEPWGIDAQLAYPDTHKTLTSPSISRFVCKNMILFFQNYISPIDGPRSSFYPTSSQYAKEAIEKYGVLKGIALGCDRLMRENKDPWVYKITSSYGIDRKVDPVR